MAQASPGPCLSEDAVVAFVARALSAGGTNDVLSHITGCTDCRELVALLQHEAARERGVRIGSAATVADGARRALAGAAGSGASSRGVRSVPPASVLASGDLVAGRFEIDRCVGAGGMGAIYRARDRHTAEQVAVKVLLECSAASLERFEREACILAELRHPGIVRYVSHGPFARAGDVGAAQARGLEPSGVFLAMEWLEGEDLAQRLKRGPLGPEGAIVVAERVAAALAVAHDRGIVHRDLKPGNIFIRSGKLDKVALLDFGIARLVAPDFSMTGAGMLIGTPSYMAPEQATAQEAAGAPADVFALGCILYECITGQRPFQSDLLASLLAKIVLEEPSPLRSLEPRTPESLEGLVGRMLSKAPADRPADAGEVIKALTSAGLSARALSTQPRQETVSFGKGELRVYSVVMAIPGRAAPIVALGGRGRATLAAHGGRVETLSDGSLLVTVAAAGAPTDQAARGARTALLLRELLLPGAPIAMATGRGDAIALYPMGEALDRAAELLRLPPLLATSGPSPIRIDDVTASLLDLRFDVVTDERGRLLNGQRDSEAIRTLLGRPTPCVGRDAELALLEALLAQSSAESVARAVVVTGHAGIGKSRLRYELLRRVRSSSVGGEPAVWLARGDPMRAGSTLGLIAESVRGTVGVRAGEPLQDRQDKLRARVARHVPSGDVERVSVFLGEMIGTRFPDDERPQLRAARLDASLMGDQIRHAWLDFVHAECAAGPLVIVLEDLHWSDLATVELVDATLGLLAERPFAVVGIGRPETYDMFPRLWARRAPQAVRLGGLSRSACERLARHVLDTSVTEETLRGVVDLAAGNAFYLEELLRAVTEGRGAALPPNVVAMAQARLEAVDTSLRRLLRAASVFGRTFRWAGVMALVDDESLHDRMEELIRTELVTARSASKPDNDQELAFRHALVREAAYAMLTEEDRTLGHRLAADWLEQAGDTDAITLADHRERGGDGPAAASWYRRAAVEAAEANDYPAALARVERGIACGPSEVVHGLLDVARAEVHRALGANALAYDYGRAAMQRLEPFQPGWYSAAREVGLAAATMGNVAAARELAHTLDPRRAPGPVSTEGLVAAACVAGELVLEYVDECVELLDAVVAALPEGELAPLAHVHSARVALPYFRGDLVEFLEAVTLAIDTFQRVGDLRGCTRARVNFSVALGLLGEWEQAESCCREALAIAEGAGLGFVSALARHNLGLPLIRLGRVDDALRELRSAAVAFGVQRHRRLLVCTHEHIALALAAAGDVGAAEVAARTAVDLATATAFAARPLAVLALIRVERGDPEGARAAAVLARDAHGADGLYDAIVTLAYVEALAACGEAERAHESAILGKTRLLARAAKITDATRRETFLARVPEHARLLQRASS